MVIGTGDEVPEPANKMVTTPQSKIKNPTDSATDVAPIEAPVDTLKKPEFLDRSVSRSGVKRRDAKPAIEAALSELLECLLRGDELNLPPLGKLKVVKSKELTEGAQVLTVKLRTMKDGTGRGAANSSSED